MKRNKLLKKALSLGLAVAVAVTSMAPTLAMLEPVVAYAVGETDAVSITNAKKAEINGGLEEKDSIWAKNAAKVEKVEMEEKTITVKAKLSEMTQNPADSGGDKGHKAFPIVVVLSKKVTASYKIDDGADSTNVDRVNDAWKCLDKSGLPADWDSAEDGKGKNCIVWLSEEWLGTGHEISFDSGEKYTIKVVDTSVSITEAKKAVINAGYTEDNSSFTTSAANLAHVDDVVRDNETKTITVKAKLCDMTKIPAGGMNENKRSFSIVVSLNNSVSEPAGSYYIGEDAEAKGAERITDAWKYLNKADSTGYNNDHCIIWLSEEWTGEGSTISFQSKDAAERDEYTIKVVDTTEYDLTVNSDKENMTVTFTDKTTGEAVNPNKVKIGKTYIINVKAAEGYYFDDTAVSTLTAAGGSKTGGFAVVSDKNGFEYSKEYTVALTEEEYASMGTDKKITVIPNITATQIAKEDKPTNVTMDYETGKLKFPTAGKYIIGDSNDSAEITVEANDTYPADGAYTKSDVGKTIAVKRAKRDAFHKDSDTYFIEIKSVSKKPLTVTATKCTADTEDGKITGVTNKMRYKAEGADVWTNIDSGTEVTGLAPGTYRVSYKSNNDVDTAGFENDDMYTTVIVGAHDQTVVNLNADPVAKTVIYGYAQEAINITVANSGSDPMTEAGTLRIVKADGSESEAFTLDGDTLAAITSGNTGSVTVKTQTGLSEGTYTAFLRISYKSGDEDKTLDIELKLIVGKAVWDAPTGNPTAESNQAGTITVKTEGVTWTDGGRLEYGYAASKPDGNTESWSFIYGDNPHFTNVQAGEYYVFVRVKADDNHEYSTMVFSDDKVTVAATSGGSGSGGGSGSSGSGGGSSSGGSSGSSGGTGTKPTPTPVVPAATTTADGTTVTLNKDGVYVDKNGKPAVNAVIKEPTGVMHITDATGHVVKDSLAVAADGKTYVVGTTGNVVISDIAEIKGNKYIADEKGQLVTDSFSTIGGELYYSDAEGVVKTDGFFNAAGKKYYADENGIVAVKTLITVNGKKYFATKNGAIAVKKIVTANGKKYFATKSGKIATNKIVKTGGKKYFATKNGSLATNKWVKVGNKKYFCNKKGVITKTKKIKAK